MNLDELLEKCEDEYFMKNYENVLKLCDEVFEIEPDNQIAMSYKSISHCFLNQHEKALETLDRAIKLYPNNYYLKNNLSMVYYDLGEYEKSLKCCDEGLKIKNFDWLYENRIKALIKLDRIDEAIECYENSPVLKEITDLLIEAGKYSQALEYCIEEDLDDFESVIDKIKEKDTSEVGDYYMSWISMIKSKSDTRTCPDCGDELIPIVWGYPYGDLLERAERGEVYLGGCVIPPNSLNHHCKSCDVEFDTGCEGLHIECEDYRLFMYIEYKIKQFVSLLKTRSKVFVKSKDTLKSQLKGFDDREFDEFTAHLRNLDYIYEPLQGYIRLVGFDDFECMKGYCDEGKYAAPLWLAYPQYSAWTIGWRMGAGEEYAMSIPHYGEEFRKLFPMPKYWQFNFSESPYKPHPILSYFWTEDGKPKYPEVSEGMEVNGFIKLDDEKAFSSDTFLFTSIENALAHSKLLYFEKCSPRDSPESLKDLELSEEEEKTWETYKYSVLLNAAYLKVMQDDDLKRKLLETGDEPLIYVSDDEENLFGRALMELRDEIRMVCENEDKIDWEYTEYLKH